MTSKGTVAIVALGLAGCLATGCSDGPAGADDRAGDLEDVVADAVADLDAIDAPDVGGRDPGVIDAPDGSDPDANDAAATCPPWQPPQIVGNLDGTDLVEVSGLAASRVHPGVLWAHNDSGDVSRVFAILLAGDVGNGVAPAAEGVTVVTAFALDAVTLSDCEDISIGPFAGIEGDALFLADTGNNGGGRDVLSVYVFPEPSSIDGAAIGNVRRIDVAYPDGTHDCESFFVDSWTGDLYFVVKEYSLATTKVFRLAAPTADGSATAGTALPLQLVAEFPFEQATAADLSPDGRMLAVRGYFDGRLFHREPGQSIATMLATEPCVLPSFLEEPYDEPQGESVAFDPSGKGFYTVSERVIFPQDIHYTVLPQP
jgi:hypothetical protein